MSLNKLVSTFLLMVFSISLLGTDTLTPFKGSKNHCDNLTQIEAQKLMDQYGHLDLDQLSVGPTMEASCGMECDPETEDELLVNSVNQSPLYFSVSATISKLNTLLLIKEDIFPI